MSVQVETGSMPRLPSNSRWPKAAGPQLSFGHPASCHLHPRQQPAGLAEQKRAAADGARFAPIGKSI